MKDHSTPVAGDRVLVSANGVEIGLMLSVRSAIDVGVVGVPAVGAFLASESGYAMRLRLDFAR